MGSLCHASLHRAQTGMPPPRGAFCKDTLFYSVWMAALALWTLVSTPAQAAQISQTRIDAGAVLHSRAAATALTDTRQERARLWGLDDTEWSRYESLMQGIRGSISPATLSPIEVLGIHARDEAERQRYAERWARMMHDDTERVLAFQRAYHDAWRRLYPDLRLFGPRPARADFSSTDQALLFMRRDCTACQRLLSRLQQQVRDGVFARLDIFLLQDTPAGALSDQSIREWAQQAGIDPALVKARRVTLNHDRGALARLSPALSAQPGPHLIRKRGGAYAQITMEAL